MTSKLCSLVWVFLAVGLFMTSSSVKGAGIGVAQHSLGLAAKSGQAAHPIHRIKTSANLEPLKYNVIYIIDSSSSISNANFRLALKAIEHLTLNARHDTKYAAVVFSTHAQVVSTFTSPENILKRLNSMRRMRGGTNIYDALKACSQLFKDSSSGVNPKALNRILIVTDGLSNLKRTKTLSEALQLKLNNIEIFVVAIGRYLYGMTEISFLATSQESHVFKAVRNVNGLTNVTQWIPNNFNGYTNHDKATRNH